MRIIASISPCMSVFFFNDTATTEIYTLSLHDALPILAQRSAVRTARASAALQREMRALQMRQERLDRKSTRLNSSHANISYAVFCLKKKKNNILLLFHYHIITICFLL